MKEQIKWLSSLRGLAALFVVTRHIWPYFYKTMPPGILREVLNGVFAYFLDIGKVGVVIFFLISGYLLTGSLKGKTRRGFAINRMIRLYPAYWFSMVLAVIFLGGFSIRQIMANATMLQTFAGIEDMVGVYWTLPIELILYIGCFLFFNEMINCGKDIKFVNTLYVLSGLGGGVMAYLRSVTGVKLPVAIPLLISAAFLGNYYRLYHDKELSKKSLLAANCFFVIMLFPICIMAYNVDMGFQERWYVYVVSYLSGLLLFALFMGRSLSGKLLMYAGGISYSLYLTHRVVISFACDVLKTGSWGLFYLLAVVGVIFIVAIGTHKYVETKSYEILNKWAGRK